MFATMKLRKKLMLMIGVSLAFAIGAALFGIARLNASAQQYSDVIEREIAGERLASNVLLGFQTQVQEWKNTLLRGKDPAQLEKHWGSFEKQEGDVKRITVQLRELMSDGEARDLVDKFGAAHATMGADYRKGLDAFKAADFGSAVGDAAVKGMDRAPTALLKQVGEKIAEAVTLKVSAANDERRLAIVHSLGIMLGVFVAGLAAAFYVASAITREIGGEPADARAVAQSIASGELTTVIAVRADDSTSLFAAMRDMQASLARIVAQVRNSSDSIATGSAEIAVGNADLSQRTEEQASNLQQTAASMEQLSGTVKTSAETAVQATHLAASASAAAVKGGEKVGTVVNTMQDIAAASKKIADIIGVIDGIAFQTNILALNAAVEAARAGEQGRGFAVVASEVRSLAGRSAAAAKEIKSLINASVEKVEVGARQVNDAGASMTEIVSQVQRVSQLITEISNASNEQSMGISQVGESVTQLDQVTQQNAALVEESAAAAESLKHQAANLAEVVSVFKISGSTPTAAKANHAAPIRVANLPRPPVRAKPAAASSAATAPRRPSDTAVAKTSTDNWESF